MIEHPGEAADVFTDAEPFEQASDRYWFRIPADDAPDFEALFRPVGKRDFRDLQLQKLAIADGFRQLGDDERANRLRNCGTTLRIEHYEKGQKVVVGSECGDLTCPTHQRARARRHFASLVPRIERYLDKNPGMAGIMVNLTMKNCASHQLRAAIAKLIRACGELMNRRPVERACNAWIRSIELTRNSESGEWHPHVHMIWFVDSATYFRPGSPIYIAQKELQKLWRKPLKADYDPVVDIRPLRGVRSPLGEEGRKSLREMIKYVLKPGSLVIKRGDHFELAGARTSELYDAGDGKGVRLMKCVPLRAFTEALRGRRLLSTSHELQGDDLNFGDELRGEQPDLGRFICTRVYVWRLRGRTGHYFLVDTIFDEPDSSGRSPMGP